MSYSHLSRREVLGGAAALGALGATGMASAVEVGADDWRITNGRIRQSVVPWCFAPMPVGQLARAADKLGFSSVELADPADWPMLKELGLVCAISRSHGFSAGWNHTENHAECEEKVREALEATAAAGFPNVITFSGMLDGMDPEAGFNNTVAGVKKVLPLAERLGVNLCLEVLNSRVDLEMKGHPGYQADTIEWGVRLCDAVGSPRMKILFDIYHVQIMQGDLITRIKACSDYVAHYHTAGVPGRNEIGPEQEVNYAAVMQAIVDTGYDGYVGQEFIPAGPDPIASLREAARICDV